MSTRYLVFAGDQFYPSGGAQDLFGVYRTAEGAERAYDRARKRGTFHDWVQLCRFDGKTLERIEWPSAAKRGVAPSGHAPDPSGGGSFLRWQIDQANAMLSGPPTRTLITDIKDADLT